MAGWPGALPDRHRCVATTVTSTTDRRLRHVTIVAAPLLLLASLAYLVVSGASPLRLAVNGIVCAAFLATGLLAWARRPANRTGRVMVATGLFLLLDPLQDGAVPALVPIGLVATTVSDILLAYLILAFPWGTLQSNFHRVFLALSAVALVSANLVALAAYDPRAFGRDYDNPFLLIRDPGLAEAAMTLSRLTSIVVLVGLLGIFAARWARASGPARRTYSPVLIPATVLAIAIMVSTILSAFPRSGRTQPGRGRHAGPRPSLHSGGISRRAPADADGPLGDRRSRRGAG